MKEIGHNSFRFSISWARLIPGGRGEVNPEAVRFYNDVIDELLACGIEPFVTLFHFDMPLELQQAGGWESREVVDAYEAYARTAFRLFGDRVKMWFTFNEPIVPVEGGYLYDFHYPEHRRFQSGPPRWPITRCWPMPRRSGRSGKRESGEKWASS